MYKTIPFDAKTTARYPGLVSVPALASCFAGCDDYQTRRIAFGLEGAPDVTVCWIEGLVSGERVSDDILRPLTETSRSQAGDSRAAIAQILRGAVYRYAVTVRTALAEAADDLTHGCCLLLFEESGAALSFEVRSENTRAVAQPTLEKSLKGAKDSFVEALRINTALVRQRLCSPQLKLRERSLGRRSHTRVALLYMDELASPALLAALERRLDRLDVDAVLATGVLEESIVDAPLSPFPQLLHTERPDRLAMYLLDGRVGMLIDGLPVALVLPVSFADFMKVTGDASVHYTAATALTLLRWAALLLSLLSPALYVAVAAFHPEMIPTRLLLSIIEAEQRVPFSAALEVLGMLFAFGLLQEAGLRLPNPVGDTVSIIGALIVGQAAVEAKVVSPIAIIVVAASGIACYALPSQDLGFAVRLTRLGLFLGAVFAGLYGVGLVSCLLLLHLSDLNSFGRAYAAPLSSGGAERWKRRAEALWSSLRARRNPAEVVRNSAANDGHCRMSRYPYPRPRPWGPWGKTWSSPGTPWSRSCSK